MSKFKLLKDGSQRIWQLAVPILIMALVLGPALLATRPAAAQATTNLRCEPLHVTGQMGELINVDLFVENAVDFFGLQSRISFDPAYVQAVDQDPGWPGVQILPLFGWAAPGFIVERDADNMLGTASYSMTRLDPQPPVSGSGAIARIVFQPVQPGTFTMEWDDAYVLLSAQPACPFPATTLIAR